jgi:hypothetical protein
MKILKLYVLVSLGLLFVVAMSFKPVKSLKGTWEYEGGIYNNKAEGPPKDYRLERRYSTVSYEAFIIQKGTKTEKYEAGNYSLNNSVYQETQTFSNEASTLIGKKIHYDCSFHNDTLIFKGKLFDGTQVEEYWKKIK